MGLASGKDIQTDCSINAQIQGKTYCFGSKEAMTQFMADPTGNLAKAQAYYHLIELRDDAIEVLGRTR
jgi:YHS domain-containing protein